MRSDTEIGSRVIDEPTAIVHDWFQGMHGSERVVDAIRTGLFQPQGCQVDILTFAAARDLLPPELAARIVRESQLARLPGVRQSARDAGRWRYLLPYMPHYFSSLDLSEYSVVISSSHACAANVRPREGALHVCYCHTPMRYAWLPGTDARRVGGLGGIGLRVLRRPLRRIDLRASCRPHAYAANSTAVRDRIRTFYGRDAAVIHPPVEVGDFDPGLEKEPGHFVWVNRLVPYKHPELVAEAFRDLPYRLTMVGIGPLERRLRRELPPNVELRGWVAREELSRLYGEAFGFVHIGEEDFGITMVEALAAGAPVVALDAGGARDIVRPGRDGVLIERAEVAALRSAIRSVAGSTWDAEALRARARDFSPERFLERMRDWLEDCSMRVRSRGIHWI